MARKIKKTEEELKIRKKIALTFAYRLDGLILDKQEEYRQNNQKEITLQEIAKEIGIGRNTLSNYRNKDRMPEEIELYKIKQYFNVPYSYLYGDTETSDLINIDFSSLGLNDEALNRLKLLQFQSQDLKNEYRDECIYKLFLINMFINDTTLIDEMYHYLILLQGKKAIAGKNIFKVSDMIKPNFPSDENLATTKYLIADKIIKRMDDIVDSVDVPKNISDSSVEYAKRYVCEMEKELEKKKEGC